MLPGVTFMKKIAIYYSPVGAIQLEYEDGVVTALKNAEAGEIGRASCRERV